eukprot:749521-Hanusia_phi.AAC.3
MPRLCPPPLAPESRAARLGLRSPGLRELDSSGLKLRARVRPGPGARHSVMPQCCSRVSERDSSTSGPPRRRRVIRGLPGQMSDPGLA